MVPLHQHPALFLQPGQAIDCFVHHALEELVDGLAHRRERVLYTAKTAPQRGRRLCRGPRTDGPESSHSRSDNAWWHQKLWRPG